MNNYFVAFVLSFAVFGVVFFGLDYALMSAQGVNLFFSK